MRESRRLAFTRPTITRLALSAVAATAFATAAASPAQAQEPTDVPVAQETPAPAPTPTPIRPVPTPALPQPPVVNSLSPFSGPATGGNEVVISHSNFGAVRAVTFGGIPAPIVRRTSVNEGEAGIRETSVTVTAPAGSPGTVVQVILDNRSGSFGGVSEPTTGSLYRYDEVDNSYAVRYRITGSAAIKTLVKGNVPLTGSATGVFNLPLAGGSVPAGSFSADLALDPSTANLTALGFLPVAAKIALVPTEKVTGKIASGGTLQANAKVRIKLPSVTAFGIQLVGGANCQAKQISAISLVSIGEFLPLRGGQLSGTFAISDLSGCGALTGIVSPLTAGTGNVVALSLTPSA